MSNRIQLKQITCLLMFFWYPFKVNATVVGFDTGA